MKYIIKFISKNKKIGYDTLIFGDKDIKGIAEKCFEYGCTGKYDKIEFRRVKKDEE